LEALLPDPGGMVIPAAGRDLCCKAKIELPGRRPGLTNIKEKEFMDTDTVLKLTLEGAMKVVDAVLKEARARGKEISVSVMDAGGHPIVFARTDKASLTTISVAENKARCAAFTAYPTGKGSKAGNERSDFHALAITLAAGPDKMVTMQGGVPIIVKGQCVGGVAVSGAGHGDGEIAQVGAAVLA
jgi:glc operon protein GlcG